jgi:uncharacterized membrane-anchored protein
MASKDPSAPTGFPPFLGFVQQPPEAMVALQKELLESYDKASAAWLARVKSEVELWSDLAAKLAANTSVHGALEAYTTSVAQRMRLVAEDGHKLFDTCQEITQKIAHSLRNGQPSGSA